MTTLCQVGPPSVLENMDQEGLDERIRREMRNREVHTPPISTFRWWARRSHTVFGSLLEAAETALGHPLLVVDPFAGGGTTLLEAARRGHRVYGQDINPWAARGMRAMLSLAQVVPDALQNAVDQLEVALAGVVERAYCTGTAWTTHTFRVATLPCPSCGKTVWLYPYALLTLNSRREGEDRAWFGCRRCGSITEGSRRTGVDCCQCGEHMNADQVYLPGRQVECAACGASGRISSWVQDQPLHYEIVLVERAENGRRWFERPTAEDLTAASGWGDSTLPVGEIPRGKETAVLLRHGFRAWKDLYPPRQRAIMTRLLEAIDALQVDDVLREILRIAAVGCGEMAGLSSRWDRFYLKSYETTSNHRFTFAPFTAEPNIWGNETSGRGTFIRRIRQLRKGSEWLAQQERYTHGLGQARVVEGPSQTMELARGEADLVLTDPPYFGDVQYGELSSIFRAWLGACPGALAEEVLVDNGEKHAMAYAELLSGVLTEAHRVLKQDGRLILTFHNRTPLAFVALGMALKNAGFRVLTWRWLASENERDFAKRDKTSCTMDLVLECVPSPVASESIPAEPDNGDLEPHFLWTAGRALAMVLNHSWPMADLEQAVRNHPFMMGM